MIIPVNRQKQHMRCSSIKMLGNYRAETSKDAPQHIVKDTPANASETAAISLLRIENLR